MRKRRVVPLLVAEEHFSDVDEEQDGKDSRQSKLPTPRRSPRFPVEPSKLAVYANSDPSPSLDDQLAALALDEILQMLLDEAVDASSADDEGTPDTESNAGLDCSLKNKVQEDSFDHAEKREPLSEDLAVKPQSEEVSTDEDEESDDDSDDESSELVSGAVPVTNLQEYLDLETLLVPLRARYVRLLKPEFIIKWFEANSADENDHENNMEELFPDRRGLEQFVEDGGDDPFLDIEDLCFRHASKSLSRLQIISLSYCWLSPHHPDPKCYHIATVAALLRCFCKGTELMCRNLDYNIDDLREKGYERFGAGDGRPVGVFWDWASIYREAVPNAPLSPREKELFEGALVNYDIWYAHKRSIVWLLTSLPSDSIEGERDELGSTGENASSKVTAAQGCKAIVSSSSVANIGSKSAFPPNRAEGTALSARSTIEKYSERHRRSGWMTFERNLATLISMPQDILDISHAVRINILRKQGEEPEIFETDEDGLFQETDEHKVWAASAACARGNYTQVCLNTMYKDRNMPVTPEDFNTIIDEGTLPLTPSFFGADTERVMKPLYTKAFQALVAKSPLLMYSMMELRDRHVRPFLPVLSGNCHMLKDLNLSENKIQISLEKWAIALENLPLLENLNLGGNADLGGNVRALATLRSLRELRLYECCLVEGNISGLAPLLNLRALNLSGTYVYGDVKGLALLSNLSFLYLNRTSVEGDVKGLSALSQLEYLYLGDTNIIGDINGLSPKAAPLRRLEELWVVGAHVDGNRVSLMSNIKEARENGEESPQVGNPEGGKRRQSVFFHQGLQKQGKLNLSRFGI